MQAGEKTVTSVARKNTIVLIFFYKFNLFLDKNYFALRLLSFYCPWFCIFADGTLWAMLSRFRLQLLLLLLLPLANGTVNYICGRQTRFHIHILIHISHPYQIHFHVHACEILSFSSISSFYTL